MMDEAGNVGRNDGTTGTDKGTAGKSEDVVGHEKVDTVVQVKGAEWCQHQGSHQGNTSNAAQANTKAKGCSTYHISPKRLHPLPLRRGD